MRRAICLVCCLLLLPSAFLLPAAGADTDAYVYPEPEVLQIDLLIQPYRYLKLIHSAEKQKYDAVVCMNEGDPQPIGVQVRGDRSLQEGMDLPGKRVPLELCFDYTEPDGAFRGNPSLKLINCLTPARVLTQLVAMQAYAFLDVPTPRITPAFVRINDTDLGVYLAVEDLNETFANEHFGTGASLYRPVSPKQESDDTPTFLFDLVTMAAKVDGGGDTIERFLEAVNRGDDLESFYDVDEFLRFMACETFILNDDGFIYNNRNFYLADDHGKLKLLPWDKDDVFSAFEDLWSYERFEHGCNNLFSRLMENETYFARYRQYLRRLNDEFLNPDTFLPWLEAYIRLLSPYFARDDTIEKYADDTLSELTTGNKLYNTMTGNLLLTFRTYHAQAHAMLCGEAESFSIPDGAVLAPYEFDTEGLYDRSISIPYRICAGYWRLRRQAMLESGGAIVGIGVSFAVVFAAALICVYRPTRQRRREKHKTGGKTT